MKPPPIIDTPAVTIGAINECYQCGAAREDNAKLQAIDRSHCGAGKGVEPPCELSVDRGAQLCAKGLSNEPTAVPIL